jgi:hypothetical protein
MSGPTARRGGAHLGRWNVSGLGCRDSRDEAITRKGIDLFFAWKQSMAFFRNCWHLDVLSDTYMSDGTWPVLIHFTHIPCAAS